MTDLPFKANYSASSFISKVKSQQILSRKEEIELFKQYHSENDEYRKEELREKIIFANVRFVVKMAMDYRHHTIETKDLISEGVMGLMHAIDLFDVESGNKFISFAVYWIRCYINTFIDENEPIKVPVGKVKRVRKMVRDDNFDDVEEEIDLRMAMDAMTNITFIDSPIADGSKYTYSEIIEDERVETPYKTHYREVLSKELVNIIKNKLSYPKDEIILKTYGLNGQEVEQTLRDISKDIPLSHERIRQLRQEAHDELKNCDELREYYERFNDMMRSK